MSDSFHLLVPFAAVSPAHGQEALRGLALPHLEGLAPHLRVLATDEGAPESLSMPHERVLAREWGLPVQDGRIPWTAWELAQAGGAPGDAAWARFTPCHWRVGRDHVRMDLPCDLRLTEEDSRTLLVAMQPYFEEDGIALEYDSPMSWLARGEMFRDLPCASLDRVAGRVIDAWMARAGDGGAGSMLRRLQQEMQMLLYTHPVTDVRAAQGLPAVNSFWVSGAGSLPPSDLSSPPPTPSSPPPTPSSPRRRGSSASLDSRLMPLPLTVANELREPALREDWSAWAVAWRHIDATAGARLAEAARAGHTVKLTLCGERAARTWTNEGLGWLQRTAARLRRSTARQLLESL